MSKLKFVNFLEFELSYHLLISLDFLELLDGTILILDNMYFYFFIYYLKFS